MHISRHKNKATCSGHSSCIPAQHVHGVYTKELQTYKKATILPRQFCKRFFICLSLVERGVQGVPREGQGSGGEGEESVQTGAFT